MFLEDNKSLARDNIKLASKIYSLQIDFHRERFHSTNVLNRALLPSTSRLNSLKISVRVSWWCWISEGTSSWSYPLLLIFCWRFFSRSSKLSNLLLTFLPAEVHALIPLLLLVQLAGVAREQSYCGYRQAVECQTLSEWLLNNQSLHNFITGSKYSS